MAGNEADVKEFVKRFQGRAEAYSKYRPAYPVGVLLALRREIGFDREKGLWRNLGLLPSVQIPIP